MKIAIPKGNGRFNEFHLLTNEELAVGDKVFPIAHGWNDGRTWYLIGVDYSFTCSGWPTEPHTILDLNYSNDKTYQVRTDHGFGPIEGYFKLIARK